MDQRFRFLYQVEYRRLLFLIGVTAVLVIGVQYFELPYGRVLSSLFSPGNAGSCPPGQSSLKAQTSGNRTFLAGQNPMVNDTETSNIVKKDVAQGNESKGTVVPEVELNKSTNGSVAEKYTAPENGTLYRDAAKDNSASLSSIQIEKIGLTSEKNGNSDSGVVPPPLALPPITSSPSKVEVGTFNMDGGHWSVLGNVTLSHNSSSTSRVPARKKSKTKPPTRVVSISEMNNLLLKRHTSSHSVAPRWFSKVDDEMLFAKSQILNAPDLKNDVGLYAPLYRNVSMFKRSYELMEKILKVYIYPDGEKPIFHQQILEGIYASEGWFMKLLEANEKFVTKDPAKAHLFYFPFSSRLLQLTLYVRKSHSRSNLIQYMKNYVEMIVAKYPFWNRTDGADHFLAACHDWAPAETRGRLLNCIRALCNADIDVGFSIGKDVSLPETYIHSAQDPLKNLGGNPPSQRPILAFFAGNRHGYVRTILLEHWESKDPDMKIFGPIPHRKGNMSYHQYMKSSKFCICPKGYEVNSPRVLEAIFHECVPVIISDNFVLPFFEVLNWESFAVIILEKGIPNLKKILLSISEERYKEMHKSVKKVQQHFLWHAKPVKYDLFHMILHSVWYNRIFQIRAPK